MKWIAPWRKNRRTKSTTSPPPEQAATRAAPTAAPIDGTELTALLDAAKLGQRTDEIATQSFFSQLELLRTHGQEHKAARLLASFCQLPNLPSQSKAQLFLALVEAQRIIGDLSPALEALHWLAKREEYASEANFWLAETLERKGDEAAALLHYEAVIAHSLEFPNALSRAKRLAAKRGRKQALVGATLLGAGHETDHGSRFTLLSELGRGGSGAVFLAKDNMLQRNVAVKLLHPHLSHASNQLARERFFDEARLAASLRHPHIVAILDLDLQVGRLVMEYADGGTLRDLLRAAEPLHFAAALRWHLQALYATRAAHHKGIVHRDIKPANLLLRSAPLGNDPELLLSDFGTAHLPDRRAAQGDAKKRDVVGTLAYMSPEQRTGEEPSSASDLYSLGVVLYESLTGKIPWPPHVLLSGKRQRGDFALPAEFSKRLPEALSNLLGEYLTAMSEPTPGHRPSMDQAILTTQDFLRMRSNP